MNARYALRILALCVGVALCGGEVDACAPVSLDDLRRDATASPPPPAVTVVYAPTVLRRSPMKEPRTSGTSLLDGALDALPQQPCPDPDNTRNPLGDTVFMRHPGLLPPMEERARRILVAAEIARTTPVALGLLDRLTEEDTPAPIRYRALLEKILRALRSADGVTDATIEEWIVRARSIVEAIPRGTVRTGERDRIVNATADLDFASGMLCLRGGSPRTCRPLFDTAIAHDPWFSAARQVRIGLLDAAIRAVPATGGQHALCDALLAELFLDIDAVLDGIARPASRVAVADGLDAAAGSDNLALFAAAAYGYMEGGAPLRAADVLREAGSIQARGACDTLMGDRLDAFRSRLSPF